MAAGEIFLIHAKNGDCYKRCERTLNVGEEAVYWSSDWKFGPDHHYIMFCLHCDPAGVEEQREPLH